jgi:hypothetical protein
VPKGNWKGQHGQVSVFSTVALTLGASAALFRGDRVGFLTFDGDEDATPAEPVAAAMSRTLGLGMEPQAKSTKLHTTT